MSRGAPANEQVSELPDLNICSAILIHYTKKNTWFSGFSFIDKQGNCILSIDHTPDSTEHNSILRVTIERGDKIIGMKSKLWNWNAREARCYDMQLVIGRRIE